MQISRIANSGTFSIEKYVPGKSVKEAQAELGIAEMVKMASNENPLGACPSSVRSLRKAAEWINVYPDSQSREIREGLARRLGIRPEEITAGNGADGVIYNLGMAVIDQRDEIIIPRITFPIYETICRVMRGVPVCAEMKGLRIDLADMKSKINDKTKLICLCNPNNPTGDALPPEEMRAFLKDVPDDVLVLLDEAYVDFTEPAFRLDSVGVFRGGMDNLFILRSFSKIYGIAGLRFGYGIGHEALISLINRIKPPFDVSLVAEQAAIDALEDEEFYRRSVEECRSEKHLFYRRLDELGLAYTPSHTNFVLIDTGKDSQEVSRALLRRGVIVRSAASYSLPGHIRVTIGRHKDNERFLIALKEVLNKGSSR